MRLQDVTRDYKRLLKKVPVVITFVIFLLTGTVIGVSAAEKDLPKTGFAKQDGVHVRAGDNINFESLCRLEKGEKVTIIDARYSWLKIALPQKAGVYIKSDYMDMGDEGVKGTVNASRVNLRAGTGTKYSILGQVSSPEKLEVISEEDGWYKVVPPAGCAAWVHSSQIVFDQKNTGQAKREKRENQNILTLYPKKTAGNLTFSDNDAQ